MLVQTSYESKVHCYWRVDPSNQAVIEDISRRLTYHLQADNGGWDSTQLLRPPETINHKNELPVKLVALEQNHFTLDDFAFVPNVSTPVVEYVTAENLIPVGKVLAAHTLPLQLHRMVKRETPVEPYRSSFLARLANELAEEELTHAEIVSCLREADSRIKKYEGRNDQLMRLSQIADYAIHKHLAEESVLLYTPSQILNYVEHLQWILPGWLHSTGQLVISSGPGIGKTSLMLQLAACITTGERFLGIQALIKPRIFFMSLEMDNHGLKYILEHQQREWSNTPEFLILDESTSLTAYENLIAENEFSLVIIDSLSELTDDDDDNQGREAKRIMKWCKKIRRRYNCAIIIIHHNRKANTGNKKPKSLDDLAGSLHFGRSTDTVLQLWEVASHYIELSGVKVRYGTKDAFFIRRNENIWYSRDAGNETRTARTNPPRDNPKPSSSDRHGDELHRPTSGTPSLGFGYNDKPK
jgi:hypothetical protein